MVNTVSKHLSMNVFEEFNRKVLVPWGHRPLVSFVAAGGHGVAAVGNLVFGAAEAVTNGAGSVVAPRRYRVKCRDRMHDGIHHMSRAAALAWRAILEGSQFGTPYLAMYDENCEAQAKLKQLMETFSQKQKELFDAQKSLDDSRTQITEFTKKQELFQAEADRVRAELNAGQVTAESVQAQSAKWEEEKKSLEGQIASCQLLARTREQEKETLTRELAETRLILDSLKPKNGKGR